MKPSIARKRFSSGDAVFTAKTSYHNRDIIGLIGTFGFHGVWICLEHTANDPGQVYSMIQSSLLAGADPIIRVKPANYADLLWLLEAGVRGIMLPRVRDVQEVRDVVAAMKFPPHGKRGVDGIGLEADFGQLPMPQYFAEANRENYLIVQIEEPEAVQHIDAIAAVPGVDVLFVGPADMTLALGKFGRTSDPEMVAIFQSVAEACRRHGKVAGLPCSPEQVPFYYEMGYRFFNVTSDYRCVFDGLKGASSALESAGFSLKDPGQINGSHSAPRKVATPA